jgi:hypothetical protein
MRALDQYGHQPATHVSAPLTGVAVFAALFVGYADSTGGAEQLFILPLAYAVLNSLFPALSRFRRGNLGLTVLHIVVFCRFVLAPTIWVFSIPDVPFRGVRPSPEGLSTALWLMLLELLCIFLLIQILAPSKLQPSDARREFVALPARGILVFALLASCALVFLQPSVMQRYNFVLAPLLGVDVSLSETVTGPLTIFSDLVLILLPIIIVDTIRRASRPATSAGKVALTLLLVIPFLTIFRGTSRFSVIVPIVLWLAILSQLYPLQRRRIRVFLGGLLAIALGLLTYFKQFTTEFGTADAEGELSTRYFGYVLDSYLGGPSNLARAVDVSNSSDITSNTMMNDVLANVMVVSGFADRSSTTNALFNEYFYGRSGVADQIVPLTGQSYMYFGVFGAPLLLGLAVWLVVLIDRFAQRRVRIGSAYILLYLGVYLGMATGLSVGSLIPLVTNLVVPYMALFSVNALLAPKANAVSSSEVDSPAAEAGLRAARA